MDNEYILRARFNLFDTMVDVLFWNTKKSLGNIQKENYNWFIEAQDQISSEILKSIFAYYKNSYANYKKGWTMDDGISNDELEEYLPTPTIPENLKPFITPIAIHIQSEENCEKGTIGVEFECTWDIENGLGVLIKDWKIAETSFAQITYLD